MIKAEQKYLLIKQGNASCLVFIWFICGKNIGITSRQIA
jgi:hypothetical protein